MIRAIALALLVCGIAAAPGEKLATESGSGTIDIRVDENSPMHEVTIQNQTEHIHEEPYVSKGCGYRKLNVISPALRNSARPTVFAELPWSVMLFHSKNRVPIFKCGGSLIDENIVLTAAHCVQGLNASHLLIRAGEWDTQSNAEPLPHQDRRVANISIHPDYASDILYNDVALLFLSEPVQLAENVETICLPEEDGFDDVNCLASGWGKNEFGETGRYQVVLKSVELSIDPPKICQNILRSTRLGKHFTLHDSFICASGVDGADTCTGDGGGPLICPLKSDPTRYAQVGIVSWGIGCNQNRIPGVYASVSHTRKWIDETVAKFKGPKIPTFDAPEPIEDPNISTRLTEEEPAPAPAVQVQIQQQQQQQQVQQVQQPNNKNQPQFIVIHQNQQTPKFILVNQPPPYPGFPGLPNPFLNQQPGVVVVQNYPRKAKRSKLNATANATANATTKKDASIQMNKM